MYDIYEVAKTPTGWSEPMNLGPNINTSYWESAPSITPDGQAIYFCSNKPGGYGGIDIYVSFKDKEGIWGEAINLGPNINTKGDEQTPFIHADNHSLYFSSNGWPGFGNADLFVVRKKIDGSWTKPMNLGYPINSFDNEGSVAISSNGQEGFIASDRPDSRGGLDIYKIKLSDNTKANKTYYLNGHIVETTTRKALPGIVKLADLTDSTQYMQINVDNAGDFVLALPYFDTLALQVNSPQHEYATFLMTADSIKLLNGKTVEFALSPLQKIFTKNFKNVFFNINAAQLQTRSYNELNALVAYLKSTPSATILIEGHTDNTGSENFNKQLSEKRAAAIGDYLIQKGIDNNKIYTIGHGASKPIGDNNSEAGRAQNRRTSFTITIP
jgi:outer membrane protein OmpA-like peptidoglycan-associated protein